VLDTPDGSAETAGIMPGSLAGGLARFVKGKTKLTNWTYWYDEVVYVVSGKGRVTAAAPPFDSPQTYDVGPGDFFTIVSSTRISFEALTDEPFVFFYAVPE
jgi:oxalate decarboxylase/phosphoglucose isomerase-like protein (cupin superfamily)